MNSLNSFSEFFKFESDVFNLGDENNNMNNFSKINNQNNSNNNSLNVNNSELSNDNYTNIKLKLMGLAFNTVIKTEINGNNNNSNEEITITFNFAKGPSIILMQN